jgi:hypothetical protein
LAAFGRRPWRKPHHLDRPASETLHIFDRDAACHVGCVPEAEVKIRVLASVTTGRGGLMMPAGA